MKRPERQSVFYDLDGTGTPCTSFEAAPNGIAYEADEANEYMDALERRIATAEGLLKFTQCWFTQYPEDLQEGIIAFLEGDTNGMD